MSKKWPPKDPDEVLDYGFDWTPRKIAGDPIASVTTTITGDVEEDLNQGGSLVAPVEGADTGAGTVTWLKGGTLGETCIIQLRAVTTSGRVLDQTMTLEIKAR